VDDAPARSSADRRTVTVLFADLVGFSTLAERLDAEDLHTLVSETFAEMTAAVERRGGVVEKYIGDAVVAVFGAPRAHEDDPIRAVETGLEMLDIVSRRGDGREPLRLRIGVNTGLVVAETTEGETGILGDAVNVAARLQEEARPDELLVSDAVWRRVRDRFAGEPVGLLQVKGREAPVEAHAVHGASRGTVRRQAPFVGRSEEQALLELLWSSAEKRNTHVVSVIGEAGVGKSRLLAELPRREDGLDVRVVCGSERPFGPFVDLICEMLGGVPADPADLEARAAALGVDPRLADPLGSFLGLSEAPSEPGLADEQQRRQLFAAVVRFLEEATASRPVLAVLEDVHWADRSSHDLLEYVLTRVSGVALMLVLASRPGADGDGQAASRASHTVIRLEPLSDQESAALVRGYLGVDRLPEELHRLVASRAEGNPFFIEELLQALLEVDALEIEGEEAILAEVPVEIPDTVQGTIQARMDRLGPAERSVLQQASVLGRTFAEDILSTVAAADVSSALASLSRSQLLVPEGDGRWIFKHALIQEVAYQTLLVRERRDLHRRTAEALQQRAGDDPDVLGILAEHFARAEAPEQARRYALRAGDVAAERMGFMEATRRYEAALRLWGDGDPVGRLSLLMRLGRAALLGGDAATARTALIEAEAGWRQEGEPGKAGAALAVLGRVHYVAGETERARQVLHSAIEVLEPLGASPDLVRAFVVLSTIDMVSGEVDRATEAARRGLDLAEPLGLDGARSQLLNTLGSCEVFAGDPGGIERLTEAMDLAERSGDAEALGRVHVNLPYAMSELGRNREGIQLCRRGRDELRRLGVPTFEWFVAGNEANMLVELGEYAEAETLCRDMLASHRAVLYAPGVVNAFGPFITLLIRTGRLEEARRAVDEVLPLAQRAAGAEFLSWILILEGELETARGNRAAAAKAIEEALDIVLPTPSISHVLHVLVPSAMLPSDRAAEALARCRAAVRHPAHECRVREAEGWLGRPESFGEAAELYEKLELPYQEARTRLEAGDTERASRLIERFGLADGPLGARLRALTVS
jgi:adenylate cyclase